MGRFWSLFPKQLTWISPVGRRLELARRWSKNQGNSEDIVKTCENHIKTTTWYNVCAFFGRWSRETVSLSFHEPKQQSAEDAPFWQSKKHQDILRRNATRYDWAASHTGVAATEPMAQEGNNTSAVGIGPFFFLGAMDRLVICSLGQLFNLDPCKRLDTTGQPCPCKHSAVAKFHRVCHSQGGSRLRCENSLQKVLDVSGFGTIFFFRNVPNILLVRNIIFPINMWRSRERSYFQTHPESKIWVPLLQGFLQAPETFGSYAKSSQDRIPALWTKVCEKSQDSRLDQLWTFAQHSCSVFRAAMRSPTWEAFS